MDPRPSAANDPTEAEPVAQPRMSAREGGVKVTDRVGLWDRVLNTSTPTLSLRDMVAGTGAPVCMQEDV